VKCRAVKRMLSAYIDDELTTTQVQKIEEHLQDCSSCKYDLEMLRDTWDVLDILPHPKPAPHFYTQLKSRLLKEEKTKPHSWIENVLVPALAAGVVILGILLGNSISKNGTQRNTSLAAEEAWAESMHLDSFDDFPTASFGEAYAELTDIELAMEGFKP
jgi:anti-sigma factor RsiW